MCLFASAHRNGLSPTAWTRENFSVIRINALLAEDFKAMGHNSRKMVEEQFDWQQIAEKTLAAYRLILPGSS